MLRREESVAGYLDELRRDLARRLPEAELQTRLAEAESHLQEGVEGRIELGLSPAEAEREAIAAFGQAHRIAVAMAPASTKTSEARGRWLRGYWGLLAFALLWSTFSTTSMPDGVVGASWVALAIVAVGFGLSSFRGGRPGPLSVLRGSIAAAFAGGPLLLATHVVVNEPDGLPLFVSRLHVARKIDEWEEMARMAEENRVRDWTQPQGTDLPRRCRQRAKGLRDASVHPLSNVAPAFRLSGTVVTWASFPPFAFDLAFGGLGWLARPRRRRGRGVA